MTLDPAVQHLLAAVVRLDGRTRDAGERERPTALAYLAGVLRGVVRGDVHPQTAAGVLDAYEGRRWRT